MANAAADNSLWITWHDSAWIPHLNPENIMDYFSERTNPFYDHQCLNEQIKMQRLSQDQMRNMTGIEYVLLHCYIHLQDPVLYVIRKQRRHSPDHVTALADYYIISGVVYRAPDLCSVVNSRLLNTLHSLQSAFTEAHSFVRYHPSKGYTWQFKDTDQSKKVVEAEKKTKREEPSSLFQRQRVDDLLADLARKLPPKSHPPPQQENVQPPKPQGENQIKQEKPEVKVEKPEEKIQANSLKPPPEKRAKLR